jgi:hypothetical protein
MYSTDNSKKLKLYQHNSLNIAMLPRYCESSSKPDQNGASSETLYWKTSNDPWYLSTQRSILWLCIYNYCNGPWKKYLDKNIAVKIAKQVYNDWSPPETINNWIYDKEVKMWIVKNDKDYVASWCIACSKPAIYGHTLVYNLSCSKCNSKLLRVGKCDNQKCLQTSSKFMCRYCEEGAKQNHYVYDVYEDSPEPDSPGLYGVVNTDFRPYFY